MPPRNDIAPPNSYNPQVPVTPPEHVDTGGFGSAISDSYHMGWMGQVGGAIAREAGAWRQATPDFDVKAHIPKGYESYADFFGGAGTQAEIDQRKAQIDANIAARKRRDARGGWSTFGTDALTSVIDPINLFAPELRGLGFGAGAAKGAATIGVAGAAAEGLRGASDPTTSRAETVASMLSSVGVGALIGGGIGALTRSAPSMATTMTRSVRPVIDANNAEAADAIYTHVVRNKESSGGKNLVGQPTQVGGRTVQAVGAGQVTAETGKAVAKQLGIPWQPERMTSHAPEDIAYQDEIGKGAWRDAVRTAHGDVETAFKVYYGGANRKYWGPKTEAYARESMAMLGYSGTGSGTFARPANAVAAINALQGLERPSHVEVDGRWLPVVDGPLPNGGLAARVAPKSASEILGEVAHQSARDSHVGETALGREAAPPSMWDGLGGLKTNEIADVARSWAVRAAHDEAFARELGTTDLQDIDALIRRERKQQQIEDMQARADAGELDQQPRIDATGEPVDRSRLQRQHDSLKERYDALEARILKEDTPERPAMVPKERNPDGSVKSWEKATTAANRLHKKIQELASEIDSLGGRVDPDLAVGQLYADASPLAFEADAHARARQEMPSDADLAELRAADRAAGAGDPYATRDQVRSAMKGSGEFDAQAADELPFGMDHDGTNYFEGDGEHIRIDTQAVLASFKDKPWTAPRLDGVEPFPEDAFASPDEWLEFVIGHEVEHSVNPRLEGESSAAYENRINAQAYERVKAARAPGGVLDSRLRKLALLGTPISALERLVPDREAAIHQSMQLLASDMAMQLAGNRLGFTPLKGGSVLQRVERWRVRPLAELQDAMRRGYLEELGVSPEGTRTEIGARVVAQGPRNFLTKAGFGKDGVRKSLAEFKEDVAAAYVGFKGELKGRTVDPSPVAKKVAARLRELDDEFEREARSVNLFNKTKELSRLHDNALRSVAGLKARAEQLRKFGKEEAAQEIDGLVAEAQARADDYAKKLDEPIMQPGEAQHYHRVYDVKALREDRDGAVQALEQAYRRNHVQNPRLSAEAAYDQLVLDPSGDLHGPGTAAGLKRLDLPWSNAEAFPYIVRDPELSFGTYARQMGSAIEMTRSFGDAYALDHIDQLRADLAERGVPKAKVERAVQLFEDARDHIVGGFHRKDPLAWDYRAARALKNIGNLAVLGRAVYSQVADLARFIGVEGLGVKRLVTGQGPAGLIGGLMSAFAGDISRFHPGGIAKLSGEAGELVTARLSALMMDSDANILAVRDSAIERELAKAQVPYFMLNLMTPWTVFWKETAGLVAAHNIIDEAKQVAAHIHGGGTLDNAPKAIRQMIERQAQHGIDPQMSQLIASMPTERGAGGLHLPNVLAWGAGGGEPPVSEGMVRVYHGGNDATSGGGRWVSTDREYAANYREGHDLNYIDLPENDPRINNPDYADQGVKQGFTFNFELTPEEAAQLRKIGAPDAARGHAARQALLAAVNGEIRRSIPTPSVLERPRVFDGTFYSKSGREEQLAKVENLRQAYASAEDPELKAQLKGELDAARREVGRAGRVQLPLLSLPFQLHVFAMSAGAKTLYGLFSSSERARFGSIVSLLLAGMTVAYLKAHDPLGGLTTSSHKQRKQAYAWDKMTWGEFAWSSFEYSNLGAMFTDVAKNVTTLARAADHDPSFGIIPDVDPSDHSLRDEVGSSAGVSPALVWGLVEPFVTNDPNNSEADAVRRIVPFNNVVWWKGAVDRLTDAMHDPEVASGASVPLNGHMATLGGSPLSHAFFAPDPALLEPHLGGGPIPDPTQPLDPAAPGAQDPVPLRKEKAGGRRARVSKPNLFGGSDTPATVPAEPLAGGTDSAAPVLRRGRGGRSRRPKVLKPRIF